MTDTPAGRLTTTQQAVTSSQPGVVTFGQTRDVNSAEPQPTDPRFGPYRPYQRVQGTLVSSVVVGEGLPNLPAIVRSADGREWVAQAPTAGPSNRVNLVFSELIDPRHSTVVPISGAAYDAYGVPGLQGDGELLSPDLIRNTLRSAANGLRDYTNAKLNESTTTVLPNGTVVTSKTTPELWTVVGTRAVDVLTLPPNTQTFTRAVTLRAGTPLVIVVGVTSNKDAAGQK